MKDRLILAVSPESEFFGRERDIDYILKTALDPIAPSASVFLIGRRWTGKSEILRRIYHRLFWDQGDVIPVYFRFRGYRDTLSFSEDYLKTFLRHYIAFIKRDPEIAREELLLGDIKRLVIENHIPGAERFIIRQRQARGSKDHSGAFRNAVGAPAFISQATGNTIFLILDDLHLIEGLNKEVADATGEFMELTASPNLRLLASLSGQRILRGCITTTPFETIELEGLDQENSITLMAEMCRHHGIAFESEILEFAARRLSGNPMYMKSIISAARRGGRGFLNLKDFSDLYTEEIAEGNLGLVLRPLIMEEGYKGLRVLKTLISVGDGLEEEVLSERLGLSVEEINSICRGLSEAGLVQRVSAYLKWTGDRVLGDLIGLVYETSIGRGAQDEVRTQIARNVLIDGYLFHGAGVRGDAAGEVIKILKSFNGQKVPGALLRIRDFSGARGRISIKERDAGGGVDIQLPQVVGAFDTRGIEKNETGPRIIIACGFENLRYDSGNEVVWMVGVKEAGSKVHLGDVESFLRRTNILVKRFRRTRVVRCMVGREGFSEEALSRLDGEGAFSIDASRFDILKEIVSGGARVERLKSPSSVKEYLVVLPMSMNAELVAARAVEEIGAEIGFDDDSLSEIKTAVVEACINAFEHSGSKGGRVRLRFVERDDGLVVYIENSGKGFNGLSTERRPLESAPGRPDKRGWGLELMKRLMDEVRFESLKQGTRLVMVKHLKKRSDEGDEKGPR